MTRFTLGTLLVAAVMLSAGMPARAQIVNGSFENDYNGWTLEESPAGNPCFGTWGIAATGFTLVPGAEVFDFHDLVLCAQSSPGLPITFTPTDGNKLAFQLQNGAPELHRMHQDITVGAGSTLHWDMQYFNHDPLGFDLTEQYLAVRIRDSVSDAILQDLFITSPGDPQTNLDHPKLTHFQADLSAFAGRTVRLSIDMQVNRDFLDVQFDNFTLAGSCTPPVINSVTAVPSVIFPPNHKMVLVTVLVDATATCGPPVCKIVAIASNEPIDDDRDEPSDDDKARPDTRIVSDLTAEVRAVKGRTYTITVECTDTAGNVTRKDTQVFVPHDRRKHDRRDDDRRDDDRQDDDRQDDDRQDDDRQE